MIGSLRTRAGARLGPLGSVYVLVSSWHFPAGIPTSRRTAVKHTDADRSTHASDSGDIRFSLLSIYRHDSTLVGTS